MRGRVSHVGWGGVGWLGPYVPLVPRGCVCVCLCRRKRLDDIKQRKLAELRLVVAPC